MIAKTLLISAASLCFSLFVTVDIAGQAQQPNDEESSRQIVLDRFNTARPLSEATKAGMNSATAMKPPVYRRTGAARIARRGTRPPATEEIGVTIWRLRPLRD